VHDLPGGGDPVKRPGVVCAGGAVVDRHLQLLAPAVPATSNPAVGSISAGGVARNVAENLALLGVPVRLVSRVGDDDAGAMLLGRLRQRGVDVGPVDVAAVATTAQYVAVLSPDGELVLGVAAMEVLDSITAAELEAAWPRPGEWLFLDCNLPAPVLAAVLARARELHTPVAVDAVSTPKVVRLDGLAGVRVLFCNLDEGAALAAWLGIAHPSSADPADPAGLAGALVGAGAEAVVLTLGPAGALIADAAGARAVPAAPADVVDVTGAGDALVATTLARLVTGAALDDAVRAGTLAAALTVAVRASVREDLAERLRVDSLP
jgi:pseudouridine kinase